MNTQTVDYIETHYKECGSHEFYRITFYVKNKTKFVYKCKKCDATVCSVEE